MPEWIQEILAQVPALGVLAFIVMSERKERMACSMALHTTLAEHNEALKHIGDGCHEHSAQLAKQYDATVREVSRAMGETHSVLTQVHAALVKMNGKA